MSTRGAVAAGHPLTAEAGAAVLRQGGNAVDAAVAAVLTSFVAEARSPGSGPALHAGPRADENVLLDFFVAVPGRTHRAAPELDPVPVYFSEEVPQISTSRRLVRGAGHRRRVWRRGAIRLGAHGECPDRRGSRAQGRGERGAGFLFKSLSRSSL